MADTRPVQLERRAVALLRQALPPTVRLTTETRTTDGEADAMLTLPDGSTALLEFKLWDGDERAARRTRRATSPAALVWVTSRSTADQRRRWRDRDESFVDLTGSVRLVLPSVIIDRTDLVPSGRSASERITSSRNPFSDRASLVVRTLLERPHEPWSATALAGEAGVSLATVSLVTEGLRRMGLLSVGAAGQRSAILVDEPAAVVAQWARRYDWRQNTAVEFTAPVGSPEQFLKRLPTAIGPVTGGERKGDPRGPRWALTLQAGAALINPHAKWNTIHAYVDVASIDELMELGLSARWSPAAGGNVVLLMPWYRTSVWYHAEVVRGLPVVSRTQLILDLWHYPVRGLEQAEFLMRRAGWARDRAPAS
jgi:hypothetical protein